MTAMAWVTLALTHPPSVRSAQERYHEHRHIQALWNKTHIIEHTDTQIGLHVEANA